MKKINLYIFSEYNKSFVYGIGTYLNELTASLPKELVNITLVHLNTEEQQIRIKKIDHIKHWYLPSAKENSFMDNEERSKQYYRNVVYLLQLHIPDTGQLIFHLNCMYSQILAEKLKSVFNCKLCLSIHYLTWSFDLLGNISRFKSLLDSAPEQQDREFVYKSYRRDIELFETVDHIICLSLNTYEIIRHIYKQDFHKLSVVYNGLSDHRQINKKNVLRRKYRLSKIPVVFFVGRLDEVKGLKYLVAAFKKVLETMPHCRLIIAGNGDFQTYMNVCEDIWTSVTFTGLIDKKHLHELYTLADIGVMTSFHEQCSYVAIEMMMHGIPLIGTTSTGLNEMIEEGNSGLHIPVEEYPDKVEIDTVLLAEKIIYLFQNPKERECMRLNSRKRYEALYTSEIMGKKMLDIYQSLC